MANPKKPKGASDEKEDPKANEPISKKHVKRASMLMKDVKRFLRYNDDLIAEPNREKIDGLKTDFQSAIDSKETTHKELSASAEVLTKTCEKSVKGYKSSAIRENVESFFVVIVIVMAVRTYFAQPFKIPTGSMQPTLNGVLDYPKDEDFEKPGLFTRVGHKVWYGRSYVKEVADEDIVLRDNPVSRLKQENFMLLFTRTQLIGDDGKTLLTIPGTKARVAGLLKNAQRDQLTGAFIYPKGSVVASGYIDTGDQVFVDRFSYHWTSPKRGEVFVFNTQNIRGIQVDRREGSQHYIKRLVGVPGDKLRWEQPNLFINGEKPNEFGMLRVMSGEGEYQTGYTGNGSRDLGAREYWAMGDNSAHSSDSRTWGIVPEENIVGRALFVFLPFGHHFGQIR